MATDRQLAEDFMRLRPQHTSDAATHRALMLRYDSPVNRASAVACIVVYGRSDNLNPR